MPQANVIWSQQLTSRTFCDVTRSGQVSYRNKRTDCSSPRVDTTQCHEVGLFLAPGAPVPSFSFSGECPPWL